MRPKTDRRHQQGDDTRQRILDTTIEIAAERGYEGTTMSMIAKQAGVSMSSIYWHFANKDALLAAVIQRSYDAWMGGVVTWSEPPSDVNRRDHVSALMRSDVIALTRNPEFLRLGLMLSLERRPNEPTARSLFHQVRRETHDQLVLTFRRLLDDGGRGADDGLARQLATITMAAADGLFIAHQIAPEDVDLETTFELLLTALLDRVLPAAADDADAIDHRSPTRRAGAPRR